MATGCSSDDSPEETITEPNLNTCNDEITCSLCLDEFKDPRILPCFHTYCKVCLDELIKSERRTGKFLCPLCRTQHFIPKDDDNGFPCNYYMTALLKNISSKDETCSICTESSVKAAMMCMDCDQFLCQTCLDYHLKLKATMSHRIAPLSEKGRMVKQSCCLKHKSEILRFFCKKCNVAICRDCKLTAHDGHSSVDIEDVSREALTRMSSLITSYNSHIDDMRKSDQALTAYQKDLEIAGENVRLKIETCLDEICNGIRNSGKLLQDTLSKEMFVKTKAFKYKRKNIQKSIQSSKKVVEHIDQVKRMGSTADIINAYKAFDKAKFKQNELALQEEPTFPKWVPPDVINFDSKQRPNFRFKAVEWIKNIQYKDTNMIKWLACSASANQNIVSICPLSGDHVLVLFSHRFGHFHDPGFSSFRRANVFEIVLGNTIFEYCSLPIVRDITCTNHDEVVCYNAVTQSFLVHPLRKNESSDKKDHVDPPKQQQQQQQKDNQQNHAKPEVISLSCDRKDKIAVLYFNKWVEILSTSGMKVIKCGTLNCVSRPTKISCNVMGYYCVSDSVKERVFVFDEELKLLTELNLPSEYKLFLKHPYLPSDVCCNSEGAIFVSDIRNNCVLQFTLDPNKVVTVSILKMKISLENPVALAIDSKNRLWVGDHNNRVCVFEF